MLTESEMLEARQRTTKARIDDVRLTAAEACRLIDICIELIDFCAKVTGKIHPAAGSMVGYARDEALSEVAEFRSQ
jgi:hypothetical protein